MNTFKQFDLSESTQLCLEKLKFTEPTEIQGKTLPLALSGQSILGLSQTGTGKTLAFGIPLIEKLLKSDKSKAIVITPTRELAKQVLQALSQLIDDNQNMRSVLLVGGDNIVKQLSRLKRKHRIVVGTPGRINDHLNRKTLSLKDVEYVVLDEADRMLDIGFSVQIDQILETVPKDAQTLLFSATMPKSVLKLTEKYLKDAQTVKVESKGLIVDKIQQEIRRIPDENKKNNLIDEIGRRTGSILVFVKTKRRADKLEYDLKKATSEKAVAIHGDVRQNKRERIIRDFRNDKFRVLIATDIAARGLDVPHIEHVINYDLPTSPEDYVHRIGRTGRAGREGSALCYISPNDEHLWHAIQVMLDPSKKSHGRAGGHRSKPPRNKNKVNFERRKRSSEDKSNRGGQFSRGNGGGFRKDRQDGGRSEGQFSRGNGAGFRKDRQEGGRSEGRFSRGNGGGFRKDRQEGARSEGQSRANSGRRPMRSRSEQSQGGERRQFSGKPGGSPFRGQRAQSSSSKRSEGSATSRAKGGKKLVLKKGAFNKPAKAGRPSNKQRTNSSFSRDR